MIRELFLRDSLLWSCAWQSTIFIVVGLVGSFILRNRSARAYQVLFLSMIAAVIVPVMSILVKHYELGMFVAEPVTIQSPAEDLMGESNYEAPGIILAEYKLFAVGKDLTSATAGSEDTRFPWASIVLCGWIAASLILAARLLVTFVLGARLLDRALPLECEKIEQTLHLAKAKLGIDKDVSIRSSRSVRSPVIWCWRRRPILLVPSEAGRFDNRVDWGAVLCHELAHWKRRDHISGFLAELTVCILPWHLLLWWAKSRLVRLSEQACDDWVVATGQTGTDYAESLLDLTPGGQMAFVPAVVRSKRGLANRVRRILQDKCGNPRTGAIWALIVSIVAAFLAVGVACAQTRPPKPVTATKHDAKYTEALIKAVTDGDIKQVKSLISKGADVNAKDKRGTTALHRAAYKGHTDISKFLIDRGADANAKGRLNMTPLHNASINGDKKTIELLLSKGADINAKNKRGRTPLFEAMKSPAAGRKEVVELLVSKGAKVPAFHLAAYMGDMERLKQCLQNGTHINTQSECGSTALHAAVNSGNKAIVEFLISKDAQVDARDVSGLTPSCYATTHKYVDILDLLLDKGADVNAKDNWAYTLLYYAIWGEDKDAVELLINKGANVNVKANDGYMPLIYAIWEGNKDLVELLINNGADVNAEDDEGHTPFYWAAMQQDSKELVELLTAKGATPVSTIHMAAATGKSDKIESFIKEGIDINTKDGSGETALHSAAGTGNMNTAELLVIKGADINAKNNDGFTPLHLAVIENHRDVAELLLAKGADINAKTYKGRTPLHWAAYMGYKDALELLIAHNANVNAKDYTGATPLDGAKINGHQEVVELLQKHRAEEGISLQDRFENATLISSGTWLEGSFQFRTDEEWFAIDVEQNKSYFIYYDDEFGTGKYSADIDTYLYKHIVDDLAKHCLFTDKHNIYHQPIKFISDYNGKLYLRLISDNPQNTTFAIKYETEE